MTVKIIVGPPVLTINKGSTFMVTDQNGEVDRSQAQGVFASDTRFVSTYKMWINDKPWERVSSAEIAYDAARLHLVNPIVADSETGHEIQASSLGLAIVRSVHEGICEYLQIVNYALHKVSIILEVAIASDFADIFEVKERNLKDRKDLVTIWDQENHELTTTYRNKEFLRRFTYKIVETGQQPSYANGRVRFPITLDAGQSWQAHAHMILQHGQRIRKPEGRCKAETERSGRLDKLHQEWLRDCTQLESSNEDLNRAFSQSVDDMGALRLFEPDLGPEAWVPAAGVPWFVTLFGRDSLWASYQNMIVYQGFGATALRALAHYQAQEIDDWRDAQPGKIMHEIRFGELAYFDLVPQTPYYGSWDVTALFLIMLHETWLWLGDDSLLKELREVALGCLEWIDKYGDLDGDGFQEYKTFSKSGFNNMSWKDSGRSVVYEDGKEAHKQPKALCELQGYVYRAKVEMAEVLTLLGDRDGAVKLESEAEALRRRFNDVFWMEDEGTYAFGLDADKKQIKSVVSNPGHCLWAGIVDKGRAERVVRRLLAEDMWAGWGVRTLSSNNPGFDPFAYQRGAVWPHDNGIIAAGMKRYGFAAEANQVAKGILDAAARFQSYRLPEVFSGLAREPESFPVQYRAANTPQAWAAGSLFHFVRTVLGLRADAPNGKLYVKPTLPEWLEWVKLSQLRVGGTKVNLRFWREGKESHFEVTGQQGDLLEVQLDPER